MKEKAMFTREKLPDDPEKETALLPEKAAKLLGMRWRDEVDWYLSFKDASEMADKLGITLRSVRMMLKKAPVTISLKRMAEIGVALECEVKVKLVPWKEERD